MGFSMIYSSPSQHVYEIVIQTYPPIENKYPHNPHTPLAQKLPINQYHCLY